MSEACPSNVALALCEALMIALVRRDPCLVGDLRQAVVEVALELQHAGEASDVDLTRTLLAFCGGAFGLPARGEAPSFN